MSAAETAINNMAAAAAMPVQAPDGTKACPHGRIRIGVFFDGTGNNRYADEPNENKPGYQPKTENAPTNVVKLWRVYIEQGSLQKKIYHHGVGTDSKTPAGVDAAPAYNDSLGGGFGRGGKARVEWAVKQLSDFYSLGTNPLAIEKLFDTYGFSRGAAIARDFVNTVLTQGIDNLQAPNGHKWTFDDGIVKSYERHTGIVPIFLGIFDTVGSFGIEGGGDDNYNFFVDHTRVRRCVHMMAEDEHRHFFPVSSCFMDPKDADPNWLERAVGVEKYQDPTNYGVGEGGNLGDPGKGGMKKGALVEIWYPGAHSDVGGGYLLQAPVAGVPEQRHLRAMRAGTYVEVIPAKPPIPEKKPQLALIPLKDMYIASLRAQVPLSELTVDVPADLQSHYDSYDGFREGQKYKIHKGSAGIYIQSLPGKEFDTNFDARALQPDFAYISANYIHDSSADFMVAGVHTSGIDGKQRNVLYMGPQPKDP